jgi:hypothetical protein
VHRDTATFSLSLYRPLPQSFRPKRSKTLKLYKFTTDERYSRLPVGTNGHPTSEFIVGIENDMESVQKDNSRLGSLLRREEEEEENVQHAEHSPPPPSP